MMLASRGRAHLCLTALSCAALAACAASPPRPEYLHRVELLALLQTLNAELLSHDSATLTLEHWCAEHRLAEPARVVARRVRDAEKPIPAELRARLGADSAEPIAYRHVQLVCGEHVLSEADNWYLPSRLTPQMNEQLERTDTPFGKIVMPLGLRRHTLSAQLLWSPLPPRWEMGMAPAAAVPLRVPHLLLQHQALLINSAQQPFSVVVETYTSGVFDFAEWNSPP